QKACFRAHFIGYAVPLRPAHGAEQHGVRRKRPLHVGFGNGRAMCVISRATNKTGFGLKPCIELGVQYIDEPGYLDHGLGADAVTWKKKKLARCHGYSSLLRHKTGLLAKLHGSIPQVDRLHGCSWSLGKMWCWRAALLGRRHEGWMIR